MATPRHITFTLSNTRFEGLNETQRSAIGKELVNTIQTRTAAGKDKNGDSFAPYNTSYKKSKHFKSAGKTDKVDLVFNDRMMNAMTYLPELSKGSDITVGFRNGSEENQRAQYVIEGHGRKGDFTQPKRDPMGVTPNERDQILSLVPSGNSTGIFLALGAAFLASIF